MTENATPQEAVTEKKQRPVIVTIFLIFTFIAAGLGILGSLIGIFAASVIDNIMSSLPIQGMLPSTGIGKSIIYLVMYAAMFYGGLMIWKMKKMGFYIYVVGRAVVLILGFGILPLIFAAAWILVYALNLKHME